MNAIRDLICYVQKLLLADGGNLYIVARDASIADVSVVTGVADVSVLTVVADVSVAAGAVQCWWGW